MMKPEDLVAHVEAHPVECVIASVSGVAGGLGSMLHDATIFFGFLSSFFGTIITSITIFGMIRAYKRKERKDRRR